MNPQRRVLITGATGFAGSHLLDLLHAAGYRVRVPVRPTSNLRFLPAEGVERVAADVRDPQSLRALLAGVSWIFHFGGVVRVHDRRDFFRVNTKGTENLYRAAAECCPELELFLFCSSLAASGPAAAADRPRREEDPPEPVNAYGESKLAAERWLEEHRHAGSRLVIVRPPAIYGPRDTAFLTFFRLARYRLLPLPAPREARASLVHAGELAEVCRFLAEGGHTGTFHPSDGVLHSWEALGEQIGALLGKRLYRLRIPAGVTRAAGTLGDWIGARRGRLSVINRDKVEDLLQPFWISSVEKLRGAGYAPRITLEAGMRETYEWYRREAWL